MRVSFLASRPSYRPTRWQVGLTRRLCFREAGVCTDSILTDAFVRAGKGGIVGETLCGYVGRILRVDLTHGDCGDEVLSAATLRKYVGGTGLGAKFLYEEVPPGVDWSDPRNRIALMSGPLGGVRLSGTGAFSIVFKGPMTNLAGATQANGFLGAFIKFAGFDGMIIHGAASDWAYLHVHDGTAELRDARHLVGKDTWDTEELIADELGTSPRRLSVFAIGPAGEHLVRFAALLGDRGHASSHNGIGAVMGSKRLKAIAVERGAHKVTVKDPERLSAAGEAMFDGMMANVHGRLIYEWGTAGHVGPIYAAGMLPVKNYTTNIFPNHDKIDGQYMRTHFEERAKPCWACRVNHVRTVKVTEGPYAGLEGEEPEYEVAAAFGSQIGNSDAGAIVMLGNAADRLGIDANESGWTIGWVMECYERGLLTKDDLDGLEPTWGNVEAASALLRKISYREGCGDWLAEGVMRASKRVGGQAPGVGVYTLKGASPRSHDHRARWYEMLDTCLSNTSTIEAAFGAPPELPDMPELTDPFSPEQVTLCNAVGGGWRQFEDCLVICRFCSNYAPLAVLEAVKAVTGWEDMTVQEALTIGRRAINQLRVFNFRHGLDTALEAPSPRYCSTPVDGPAKGIGMAEHFERMRRDYWKKMEWDADTGRPLPETLEALGLEHLIGDLTAA